MVRRVVGGGGETETTRAVGLQRYGANAPTLESIAGALLEDRDAHSRPGEPSLYTMPTQTTNRQCFNLRLCASVSSLRLTTEDITCLKRQKLEGVQVCVFACGGWMGARS